MKCCGLGMLWSHWDRGRSGSGRDYYFCSWCGRVVSVERPRVSPRYLRAGLCT